MSVYVLLTVFGHVTVFYNQGISFFSSTGHGQVLHYDSLDPSTGTAQRPGCTVHGEMPWFSSLRLNHPFSFFVLSQTESRGPGGLGSILESKLGVCGMVQTPAENLDHLLYLCFFKI